MLGVAVVAVVQEAQAQRHLMDGDWWQVLELWEDLIRAAQPERQY